VSAYNQTVGSLESRVLVTARRLNDLGVVDGDLEPLAPIQDTSRSLSAPELLASGPAELAPSSSSESGRPVGLVRAGR
jgi:DNA recombination protein RmuC